MPLIRVCLIQLYPYVRVLQAHEKETFVVVVLFVSCGFFPPEILKGTLDALQFSDDEQHLNCFCFFNDMDKKIEGETKKKKRSALCLFTS